MFKHSIEKKVLFENIDKPMDPTEPIQFNMNEFYDDKYYDLYHGFLEIDYTLEAYKPVADAYTSGVTFPANFISNLYNRLFASFIEGSNIELTTIENDALKHFSMQSEKNNGEIRELIELLFNDEDFLNEHAGFDITNGNPTITYALNDSNQSSIVQYKPDKKLRIALRNIFEGLNTFRLLKLKNIDATIYFNGFADTMGLPIKQLSTYVELYGDQYGYEFKPTDTTFKYPWWLYRSSTTSAIAVDYVPIKRAIINNITIHYDVYDNPIPEIPTDITNIDIQRGPKITMLRNIQTDVILDLRIVPRYLVFKVQSLAELNMFYQVEIDAFNSNKITLRDITLTDIYRYTNYSTNFGRRPTFFKYLRFMDDQFPQFKAFILPIGEMLDISEPTRLQIRITYRDGTVSSTVHTFVIGN